MDSFIYDEEEDLSPVSSPPLPYPTSIIASDYDYSNFANNMDSPDSKSLYTIQKEQKNSSKESFNPHESSSSSSNSQLIEPDYDEVEKEYIDISEAAYKNLIAQTSELFRSNHFNTIAVYKDKLAKQNELHIKDKKHLNDTIKALETDYNSLNSNYMTLIKNHQTVVSNIVTRKENKYQRFLDIYSIKNVFTEWRRYTEKKQLLYKKIEQRFEVQSKVLLHKVFCEWKVYNKNKIWQKRIGEVKYKYDTLINDMANKYESELTTIRTERDEALELVKQEQLKRQVLEEEMRRLLVRNISFMNKEVLDIFTHINSDLPTPPQTGNTSTPLPTSSSTSPSTKIPLPPTYSSPSSSTPLQSSSAHSFATPTIQHQDDESNQSHYDKLNDMYQKSLKNATSGSSSQINLQKTYHNNLQVHGQGVKTNKFSSSSSSPSPSPSTRRSPHPSLKSSSSSSASAGGRWK